MIAENIILSPIITEKTSEQIALGRYTFKVDKKSNKYQIARAVEELFKVKVLSVNTINMEGKLKKQGKTQGRKANWKKAIVQIDLNPKDLGYLTKDGKEKKSTKKYNTEIEGFLGV